MKTRLSYRSLPEQWKIDRAIGFPTTKLYGKQAFHEAITDGIAILEVKVRREKPKEWVFWYTLSDWYATVDRPASAVRAAEKCVELRPNNVRSLFALAVSLRVLTNARHREHPIPAELQEFIAMSGADAYGGMDADKSQRGLDELGLTVEGAAERSSQLFERILHRHLNELDKRTVYESLASVYTVFPHLDRKTLRDEAVSESLSLTSAGNPYEEADQRLRYLRAENPDPAVIWRMVPRKCKHDTVEIIRLCQVAIHNGMGAGDAYVLLALGYIFASASPRAQSSIAAQHYLITRAQAVISEWALRQPPTVNIQVGKGIYERFINQLTARGMTEDQIHARLRTIRERLLEAALSPGSLRIVREII